MSAVARARFLGAFEPTTRPHIIEFGKSLSRLSTDIVVLMARKAACLVDSMGEADLTRLTAATISDRSLDMDLEWVRGKHVTLVDDVLITGSTLRSARMKLLDAGATGVSIRVLSVDSYWNAGLVRPDGPHLITDPVGNVRLCTQIVEAISVTPRPYNVDWPLLDNVSIPMHALHFLTSMTSWRASITTTSKQNTNHILSVTHEATPFVARQLDQSLGWPVSDFAPLIKVRVLAAMDSTTSKRIALRVMPIVAFEALPVAAVNSMFDSIAVLATDRRDPRFDEFTSPGSRLRLVQYAAAARLFALWQQELSALTDVAAIDTLDPAQMRYVFPPHLAPLVQKVCSSEDRLLALARTIEPDSEQQNVPASAGNFEEDEPDWLQARLTHPFHVFYTDRELPARELFRSRGEAALDDPDGAHLINRLRTGHNLTDLERVATSPTSTMTRREARILVSRYLDIAIDHGVVVPIIEERDGRMQRAYRHGEDIFFSKSEQRLFHHMLTHLIRAARRRSLNRTVVEKSFVLLLRAGVAQNFLNEWTGKLGDPKSIGIRYNIYGAVVQSNAPELFGPMRDQSLARLMRVAGTLEDVEGRYRPAPEEPEAPTVEVSEAEAAKLGALLGTVLSAPPGEGHLDEDELALVATCPTDRDVALALAAEVDVIVRQWPALLSGGFTAGPGSSGSWQRRSRGLEDSVIYQAAESGVWKYNNHRTRLVDKIVDRVGTELLDPIHASSWRVLWARLRDGAAAGADQDLNRLINRLGNWLTLVKLQFDLMRASYAADAFLAANATGAREAMTKALNLAQELARHLPQPEADRWRERVVSARRASKAGSLSAADLAEDAVKMVTSLVASEAAGLIDYARSVAAPFGQAQPIITYTSALAVEVRTKDANGPCSHTHAAKLKALIDKRRKLLGDRGGRSAVVGLSHPGHLLVCVQGTHARHHLTQLAADIVRMFTDRAAVDVYAIPELPERLQPHSTETGSECHAAVLMEMVAAHERSTPVRPAVTRLTITAPGSRESVERFTGSITESVRECDISVDSLDSGAEWVTGTMEATSRTRVSSRIKYDVGVITVVSEQAGALREALAANAPQFSEWTGRNRRWFTSGVMSSPSGRCGEDTARDDANKARIITTQTTDQGNRSVMRAYEDLMREGRCRVFVLVDIAGGIHKDVGLADVVIGDRIIYYDARALTEHGESRRGDEFRLPVELTSVINRFFTLHGEPALAQASAHMLEFDETEPGNSLAAFKIVKGPIASGEAVIKHRDSEVRRWIHTFNDKTLAVETEAAGLATAAHEEGRDAQSYGALVIRGISDHADHDKNDLYRKAAAANAVEALRLLLPVITSTLLSERSTTTRQRRPDRSDVES